MKYLRKFLLLTADVCETLQKLTSMTIEWMWNNTYQKLYERAVSTIWKDASMSIYNEKEQLYLETNALNVSLEGSFLQVRDRMWFPKDETANNMALWPIAFASKSMTSAET